MAEMQNLVAPQQSMMGQSEREQYLKDLDVLLVKQTPKGWLKEMCCCEQKSEFNISKFDKKDLDSSGVTVKDGALEAPNMLYGKEDSSCLMRCCCRDGRSFNMDLSAGEHGQKLGTLSKPLGFPLYCTLPLGDFEMSFPCCCLLPRVNTLYADGSDSGAYSQYDCHTCFWIPKLSYSEDNQVKYILRPETCCGGCCIKCRGCRKGAMSVPFYFHDPETDQVLGEYDDVEAPQIRKLWRGWKTECCTTADTFMVSFPPDSDARRKLGLLGLTFLLDFTVFERQAEA